MRKDLTMKLFPLLTIICLVESKSKDASSDNREGRQMPQGFPSMMSTTGNPSNPPMSGDLGLPTLPNFNNLGLSANQVPPSIRNMQPGTDSFNNMFQKMFSSNLLSGGGSNPLANMFGSMGGLPSMGGFPSLGGGLPGMGSGFPGMGGGFPDMMGGADMFNFGAPTTIPTTTTTTTTTTTAAPMNSVGGLMGFNLPFGGSMQGLENTGLPGLGGMGLPSLGGMGLPNLGGMGAPSFGSMGLPSLGGMGSFNFNGFPSLSGVPQLSNPSNGSSSFQNFANMVPMIAGFNQQLGRSDDEDVSKLQNICCRIGLAYKNVWNESKEACQKVEICHSIKEAHDFGEVGVSSSKPLCVAGCKMLSSNKKMSFESCFKTIVQSEMKDSCEIIFPGCEKDEEYWVSLNNICQEQIKVANEMKRKLAENNETHRNENETEEAESEFSIKEPEKEATTTSRSNDEKQRNEI